MSLQALSKTCANHPDRSAAAICVDCRRSICQECATRWDGINYCISCLRKKRGVTAKRRPFLAYVPVIAGSGAMLAAAAWLLVWMGALIAGFF